jgi:hypothetical protein
MPGIRLALCSLSYYRVMFYDATVLQLWSRLQHGWKRLRGNRWVQQVSRQVSYRRTDAWPTSGRCLRAPNPPRLSCHSRVMPYFLTLVWKVL